MTASQKQGQPTQKTMQRKRTTLDWPVGRGILNSADGADRQTDGDTDNGHPLDTVELARKENAGKDGTPNHN